MEIERCGDCPLWCRRIVERDGICMHPSGGMVLTDEHHHCGRDSAEIRRTHTAELCGLAGADDEALDFDEAWE